MELLVPPASVAPFGLRAMAMIARAADGGLVDTHRVLLDTAQQMLLGTEVDVATLPEIDPATLREHFSDRALAQQLVRGMLVVSLAVGPTTPAQMELIEQFADALGIEEPALDAIAHLAHGEMVQFVLDFHRRSNLRDYIANQYRNEGGLLAVIKGLLEFRGVIHDQALVARFVALGELPQETFGHAFFHHSRQAGVALPGESGGFPMGAVFHDIGHVLAGYDITPEGELQIACFQAGYRRADNAFFTILFAVLLHTAGINIAPLPMPHHPGRIGEGDLAARMIHALRRGAQVNTDLGEGWDLWSHAEIPLAELRRQLGVPPLADEFRTGVGVYGPPIGNW